MEQKKYPERWWRHLLAGPLIWLMIIPLVILDFFLKMYHQICFRLYRIPLVPRQNYIRIDRQKLAYLGPVDKLFCMYCGYANGLVHYASVIAGETEKYWCAIKHAKYPGFVPPAHHKDFLEYGDEAAYREKYGR